MQESPYRPPRSFFESEIVAQKNWSPVLHLRCFGFIGLSQYFLISLTPLQLHLGVVIAFAVLRIWLLSKQEFEKRRAVMFFCAHLVSFSIIVIACYISRPSFFPNTTNFIVEVCIPTLVNVMIRQPETPVGKNGVQSDL